MNKNIFIWLFIILFGLFIFNIYYKPKKNYENVIFSDFVEAVQTDKITSVTFRAKISSVSSKMARSSRAIPPMTLT